MVERPLLPAPPRRQTGQDQLFAEQLAAQPRQKRHQRLGFDHAAAERIGDGDRSGARRLKQPGDAEGGSAAQLQRIAVQIVDPANDEVDRFQPVDGLEIHAVVAHGEVGAFGKAVAKIAGDVGMGEVAGRV